MSGTNRPSLFGLVQCRASAPATARIAAGVVADTLLSPNSPSTLAPATPHTLPLPVISAMFGEDVTAAVVADDDASPPAIVADDDETFTSEGFGAVDKEGDARLLLLLPLPPPPAIVFAFGVGVLVAVVVVVLVAVVEEVVVVVVRGVGKSCVLSRLPVRVTTRTIASITSSVWDGLACSHRTILLRCRWKRSNLQGQGGERGGEHESEGRGR